MTKTGYLFCCDRPEMLNVGIHLGIQSLPDHAKVTHVSQAVIGQEISMFVFYEYEAEVDK